jgi:hypothetical protein
VSPSPATAPHTFRSGRRRRSDRRQAASVWSARRPALARTAGCYAPRLSADTGGDGQPCGHDGRPAPDVRPLRADPATAAGCGTKTERVGDLWHRMMMQVQDSGLSSDIGTPRERLGTSARRPSRHVRRAIRPIANSSHGQRRHALLRGSAFLEEVGPCACGRDHDGHGCASRDAGDVARPEHGRGRVRIGHDPRSEGNSCFYRGRHATERMSGAAHGIQAIERSGPLSVGRSTVCGHRSPA